MNSSVRIAAAVTLGTLLAMVGSVWAADPNTKTSQSSDKKEDQSERVDISGGLSGSEVASKSSVLYWVTIDNHSKATLSKLNVRLIVAGDEFHVTCRLPNVTVDSPGCGPSTAELAGNESLTIQGEVRALQGTEPRSINAIVTYEVASALNRPAVSSIRAVSIGPLVAHSWAKRWYDNTKDLILPSVLAFLGFFLTWKQNRFQAKLQSQDQDKQAERAQVAQTWSNMLPVSHEMATKFYTPMLAAVMRALSDLKKFSAEKDAAGNANQNALSCYFHIMLLWRRFDYTLEKKGGIYFKSRMGEKLVLHAFAQFRKEYQGESSTAAWARSWSSTPSLSSERNIKEKAPHFFC